MELSMNVVLDKGAYMPEKIHPHNFIDLTGMRFGNLLVIKQVEDYVLKSGVRKTQWLCKCDCGNEKKAIGESLRNHKTISCGCVGKSNLGKLTTTHGKRHERIYGIYCDMKKRCYNTHAKNYKHYGAKGVRICKEWLNDFMSFYNWSINHGYTNELTIDRIDSSGNYEPSNCHWITKSENVRKRNFEYWRKWHESKIG